MAWVYQVEKLPTGSNSLWALKELRTQTADPDTQAHAYQLFKQEAALLSQLDHPNLPQVIDFFEDQGRAYLVMEFVWGESLEKRIEKAQSPLLERQVLQWAVQACEVLDYLHTRQPPIIFRDLKPSNIMVNNAGVIKLVDFGIARTYKENKLQDTIALGSENYAAPEQWGEAQTDPRSDIYALGATIYHLLGNMPPSPAFLPSEPTSLGKINPAVSAETVNLVTKAMVRDRGRRFQSAIEMKEAILAIMPGYVSPLSAATPVTPSSHAPQVAAVTVTPAVSAIPAALTTPAVSAAPVADTIAPAPSAVSVLPATPAPQPTVRRVVHRVKLCPQCQHKNELPARFCVRCGYAFVGLRPAVLRVIEPVRAAWEMPVNRSPLMLGRAAPSEGYRPDLDMTFYDPEGYVSRRHAQITREKSGYVITDLGSSNGTYVNDQPLIPNQPYLLRHGDRIEIGEVAINFLLR